MTRNTKLKRDSKQKAATKKQQPAVKTARPPDGTSAEGGVVGSKAAWSNVKRTASPELQNEGEGSRSAARRYDAAVERMDPKRVEELAEKARRALEGPEGDELRRAEDRGKRAVHR